jgi:hypothetical protein
MTNVLKLIVTCEEMRMQVPFEHVCFAHALFKACQFSTSNEKISYSLQPMSIKTI